MLKKKSTLIILLSVLIALFASINFAASAKRSAKASKPALDSAAVKSPGASAASTNIAAKADPAVKQETRELVVYYFMTTYRCRSCIFLENTTRSAVNEFFGEELKNGRVLFKTVNIDEPANKHFIDEYGLFTKSVVISDLAGGKQTRWKNLDQVWNMIGQEDAFKAYIAKEVKTYLGS